MRGIEPRELEGKDFPHDSGELTRGLASSGSEARKIPPQLHQEIKG
jgi:hypothetical protein